MSEHLSHAPKHEKMPSVETNEAAKEHLNALKRKAEADKDTLNDEETLAAIKQDVEEAAISKDNYKKGEAATDTTPAATYVSRELKEMGFRRNLTTARMHMSAPARLVSKVIHQPVVEKISDVAAPTVARPSGILGGGLFALIGSSVLLYITKHYGYQYNYLVFILLFVGGFVLGMIAELLLRAAFRRKA